MVVTTLMSSARCPVMPSPSQRCRLSHQIFFSFSSSFTKMLNFDFSPHFNSFHSISLSLFLPLTRSTRGSSATLTMMSMEDCIGVKDTKLGMMSYFELESIIIIVTIIGFREGNIITQNKATIVDDYDAVQVGYHSLGDLKLTKLELGHLNKADAITLRHLQEFLL